MQQVMSQNGPIVVDITAFQLAQACGTLKLQAMLEVNIQPPALFSMRACIRLS